jgi:hypothetical protein
MGFPGRLRLGKSKWRFYIDYRKLNVNTTRDSYPIPDQDEQMEFCKDKPFRSQLDALMGYRQIKMNIIDKDKTAFITTKRLWRYLRLPFGLSNAPATFQRFLNETLASAIKSDICRVYIDNIIIASTSFEEQMTHIKILPRPSSNYYKMPKSF